MNAQHHWYAGRGEYFLEITLGALQSLQAICEEVAGNETGGILIGYYTDDYSTAVITEITFPPIDSVFGTNWFTRGVIGLRTLLAQRWKSTSQRTYYLGEWHYHPSSDIAPSKADIEQMRAISHTMEYQCKEPIMLIAGSKLDSGLHYRIFVFPDEKPAYEYHQGTFNTTIHIYK